ncbi:serine O-acetyltransferase [Dechloromonas sp. HYN0024]|nr:serine O-acetyltransferase [Dechloromonas sp. HYN0024]
MTATALPQSGLWATLKEDLACVFQRDPAARSRLEVLTTYPGVHAILTHRLSHRLWQNGWRFPARFLSFLSRMLTNVDIHPGATIGHRFFIDHGACVVIGETAEVGDDVTLYHGVTLGGTSWNKGKRHPTLADGVVVGAGAKILGPITIGERVRVGANSVVVKDVPADRTVVGVPGRIVDTRIGTARPANGISLDHNLMPDPVAKSIACLIERIEILEKELAEVRHEPPPADHSGECRTCSAGDLCCEHESMHPLN